MEVSVKVACQSTTATNCSHRAYPMLVEVQSYHHGSICESDLSVHDSHRLQAQSITMQLILVEVTVKVACRSTTATDCRHRAITMLLSMDCYWKQIPMTMRMIPILNVNTTYDKVHIQ